jgi:hypothetical protein
MLIYNDKDVSVLKHCTVRMYMGVEAKIAYMNLDFGQQIEESGCIHTLLFYHQQKGPWCQFHTTISGKERNSFLCRELSSSVKLLTRLVVFSQLIHQSCCTKCSKFQHSFEARYLCCLPTFLPLSYLPSDLGAFLLFLM